MDSSLYCCGALDSHRHFDIGSALSLTILFSEVVNNFHCQFSKPALERVTSDTVILSQTSRASQPCLSIFNMSARLFNLFLAYTVAQANLVATSRTNIHNKLHRGIIGVALLLEPSFHMSKLVNWVVASDAVPYLTRHRYVH